jgi:hypothetical protein
MGVKLPLRKLQLSVLTAVLISVFISGSVMAQVAINNASFFEVTFNLSETRIDNRSVSLSVADITGVENPVPARGISAWDADSDIPPFFYVEEFPGSVALSGPKPAGSPAGVYAHLNFENRSGSNFSGINVAFDFLYKPIDDIQGALYLQVKPGNLPWTDVQGSRIQLSNFSASGTGSTDWQTFSVQSAIDDIYTRDGDPIEFRWVFENEPVSAMPLAIQSIELTPEVSGTTPLRRGSLIITEIFAGSETDNQEYLELYNPTDSEIPILGLEIHAGENSVVIQKDIRVEPYSYAVLSGSDFPSQTEFRPDYIYYHNLLPSGSGFIELIMGGEEAARASYDISDPGSSVELDRSSSGFDGYSSLQNFVPSISEFGIGLRGSPGSSGNSIRHYSKTFSGSDTEYALITVPGILSDNLNRLLSTDMQIRNLSGEPVTPDNMIPGRPYLLKTGLNRTVQLHAEEGAANTRPGKYSPENQNFSFLNLPVASGLTLAGMINDMGQPVTPAVQVWDSQNNRFRVIHNRNEQLSSWDALMVNREVPAPSTLNTVNRDRVSSHINRSITLSLFEEADGRREVPADESHISFINTAGSRSDNIRYDLPKMLPLMATEANEPEQDFTLFYVRNPESNQSLNSFTHLPFEPGQDYRLSAGLRSTRPAVQSVLRWTLTDDIPEEWNIMLEDRLTGQRIDMREQESYRFRHASQNRINVSEAGETPLQTLEAEGDDRFNIIVSPYESLLGSNTEEERPGTVELRQNYPNPFNPATNIVYYLPEDSPVRIGIFNVVGQQVATLVDEVMSAGEHSAAWNASDMPSGIYIVQLETGNRVYTRKITLIK